MSRVLTTAGLLAAFLIAGCDSTPAVTSDADTKAKVATDATAKPSANTKTVSPVKTGTLTPVGQNGPKRLEVKRPVTPGTPVTPVTPGTPAPAIPPAPTPATAVTQPPASSATTADPTLALMNPGDEVVELSSLAAANKVGSTGKPPVPTPAPASVAAAPNTRAPSAAERAAAARMAAGSDAQRQAQATAAAARTAARTDVDGSQTGWSVLLASVTGAEHQVNANAIREEVVRRYPQLNDAYVSTTQRGSVVLVGHFTGPQDPAAQAELKVVKEINEGTTRAFPRAMLTRMGGGAEAGPPGPNDLRIVRRSRPNATLYSLQVAVWSAFGTSELKMSEIKRSAETYCRQLRADGNEAYYFHDFDTKTSIVTVGVFGADAYDSKSTLYAPEVEAVMRKFPKHLVNGEELLMPVDMRDPTGKTMPQSPRLVEIPKF
ncbi:MAG: hypothetical protein NT059_02670 [Planctomycetota bacterium]|nr:hypothetical protein [Planctomycetota bacterium]